MKSWMRERILWWRCFLPVVFAHKPLCRPFHGHHVQFGKWHLCRSCLLLWTAAALASLIFWLRTDLLVEQQTFFVMLVAATMILSYPDIYKTYPRWLRDMLRMLLGVSGAVMFWLLLNGQWQNGVLVAAVLASAKLIFTALRVRNREDVCQKCPEFQQRTICSGFALKSHRMRLYERALQRFLLSTHRH